MSQFQLICANYSSHDMRLSEESITAENRNCMSLRRRRRLLAVGGCGGDGHRVGVEEAVGVKLGLDLYGSSK